MRLLEVTLFVVFAMMASLLQAAATRSAMLASILRAQKSGQILTPQQRLQQEQTLYQHLKNLPVEQVAALQRKMPQPLMRRIVERIKVLKEREGQKVAPGTRTTRGGGPNTVMSRASSVRRSSSAANKLGGKGRPTGTTPSAGRSRMAMMRRMAAAARRMMSQRRRRMNPLSGFRSFTGKAQNALGSGCSYPINTESVMETFLAGTGGCRVSAAVCYMKGMSCVDVGMSMMCCPAGYSSGTLRMMNQMKQMQTLINSMS